LVLVIQGLVVVVAALLAAVTLLPLVRSHAWWVRMWDFPRVQIAVGLAAVLPLAFVLPAPLRWVVLAVAAGCLAYQAVRIYPYTPLARKEMILATGSDAGAEATLLASNVLMENTDHARVRALIEKVDPDLLLLMETDRTWIDALEPVLARYPTVLTAPRDDCYGMVFATRLEVDEACIVPMTEEENPAAFAALRTPGGALFRFVGLHPQPPMPGDDTEERDAQILYAARFARADEVPLVAMGDFNDAAWSDTARRFKHYGRYVDPRIGRGIYASFDANRPLFRCAVDQLYVTEDMAISEFRLGPHVGSDHFPVIVRIRVDRALGARLNRQLPEMSAQERADLDARVETYRRRMAEIARD
jgi:endonuclease/exonuclease/phosphatase (EEP) superfamily protein YafD